MDKFRARVVGPMEADGFGCEEDSNVVAVGSVRDVQVAEEVVRRSYLRMAREVERSESRNFRSRSWKLKVTIAFKFWCIQYLLYYASLE